MSAPAAPAPSTETRTRLLAALVLIPLYVAALVIGRWVFLLAVLLLTLAGTLELYRMMVDKPYRPRVLAGLGLALAFPLTLYLTHQSIAIAALVALGVVGVGLSQLLDPEGEEAVASVGATILGAVYVGLLMAYQILVREVPREIPGAPYLFGALLLAVPVLLTWVNDTAAYFVGHRWGRRKLIRRVSPGKSLEGAVGALAATVLAALALLALVNVWVSLFDLVDALTIGLLLGVAAPCGDLVESSFKRDLGVKDSSRLIPGHGGILDRFDSLLVTVPVYYHWLVLGVL